MVNTFVFMGRPGSGKGKQSELLAKKLGCRIFSTGARYREMTTDGTLLGQKIKKIMDAGDLTPSWLASFLFEQKLLNLDPKEPVVFEGVGRKLEEAKLFNDVCGFLERDFKVIYLETSEDIVRERIAKRASIEGRSDDKSIENRFKKYNEETLPAINFFRSIGKVIDINGEPLPEVVEAEIQEKLSHL